MPRAERAMVPDAKVKDYLLHPEKGNGKHLAFNWLGYYREQNWQELQKDLKEIARTHHAWYGKPAMNGLKYEIAAKLTGPNGRSMVVKTVWIVDFAPYDSPAPPPAYIPRFVTAYPGKTT